MNYLIGQLINQYDLDALLGEGGMGAVYRAIDLAENRSVAVKVMHPHLARQPQFQQRFTQEATAAASLDHPAIIKVYDHGLSEEGFLFLVMELLSGGSLGNYLKQLQWNQKQLPIENLVGIGAQVAEALNHAHENGVVHRDIKPDNILFRQETHTNGHGVQPPEAVVTDFGLATLSAVDEDAATNPAMGTLAYMSPEQSSGDPVDGRADLYSLGVMLYQMATGRLPFEARSLAQAVRQHLEEIPAPPSKVNPDLPAALDTIIMRALSKKPANRYQTGNEMAAALREVTATAPVNGAAALAGGAAAMAAYYSGGPEAKTQLEASEWVAEAVVGNRIDANHTWTTEGDYRLLVAHKWERAEVYGISKPIITIGRADDNDIVLEDATVSRHHLSMERIPEGWQVVDLGSTNGTYMGSDRLGEAVPERWLNHKTLRVGPYFLQWQSFADSKKGKVAAAVAVGGVAAAAFVAGRSTGGNGAVPPPNGHANGGGAAAESLPFGTETLGLRLMPEEIEVAPGAQTQLQVECLNQGDTVDHFFFRVDGIPADWSTVPTGGVQLLPGALEVVPVTIHPPAGSSTTAGEHTFNIVVSSASTGVELAAIPGDLYISPFSAFEIDMHPTFLQENVTCRVTVSNEGNQESEYHLVGIDDSDALLFTFQEPRQVRQYDFNGEEKRLTIAPGDTQYINYTLRPKLSRRLLFVRKKIYPFEIRVRDEREEWRSLFGQIEVRPIVSIWVILLLLFILLLIALGFFAFRRDNQQRVAAAQAAAADARAQSAAISGDATAAAASAEERLALAATLGEDALATAVYEATQSAIEQELQLSTALGAEATAAAELASSGGDSADGGGADGAGGDSAAGGSGAAAASGDGADGADGEAEGDAEPTAIPQSPPIANLDENSTDEDTPLSAPGPGLLSNDSDPDGDAFAISDADTESELGAEVSVNGNGGYSYDPQVSDVLQTLSVGDELLDTFTYTIEDSAGGSTIGTVQITVNGANDDPLPGNDSIITTEDQLMTSSGTGLLANDTDPDTNDTLVVSDYDETSELGAVVLVNADGTFSYNPAGSVDLRALAQGETILDSFTYTVSDENGGTAVGNVNVIINGVNNNPVAVNDTGETDEDSVLNILSANNGLLANDSDPDENDELEVIEFDNLSDLGAIVAVNANGTWSYAPGASPTLQTLSAGERITDTFTYTIEDSAGATDVGLVQVGVEGTNDRPMAQNDNVLTNEDIFLEIAAPGVLANDINLDLNEILTVTLTAPPSPPSSTLGARVTLNPNGGYSYNPTNSILLQGLSVGETAIDSFRYEVCDSGPPPACDDAIVNVIVNGVNDLPTFTSTPPTTGTQGMLYEYNIIAIDPDSQDTALIFGPNTDEGDLTITAPILPQWLSLSDYGDGTALLSGTPGQSNVGTHSVTIQVEDQTGSIDIQSFSINIENQNDPPVVSDLDINVPEDTTISFTQQQFRSQFSDIDGDSIVNIRIDSLPVTGTLRLSNLPIIISTTVTLAQISNLTYTPPADWNGLASFLWNGFDGQVYAQQPAFVNVTLSAVNDPPTFTTTPIVTATQNTQYIYDVIAEDPDPFDNVDIVAETLPSWLTLIDNGDGTARVIGTPGATAVGNHNVSLRVFDDLGTGDLQSYTLEVINVNDPPHFTSTPVTGAIQDQLYIYDITTEDLDTDDTLVISATFLPDWLTLADNGNGTAVLNGTPLNDDVGSHNVALRVTDAAGAFANQLFIIIVSNVNNAPMFTSTPVTTATQGTQYVYNITAIDPDPNDELDITAPEKPSWLIMSDNGDGTAVLSGTPDNDDVGNHSVTLRVTDLDGAVDTQAFNILVSNINDPPIFTSTPVNNANQGEQYLYSITTLDPDVGDTTTITADSLLPNWLNLTDNGNGTGSLLGTPQAGDGGIYTITLRAEDLAMAFSLQTFNIVVATENNPPAFTSSPVTTATEDQQYTYNVTATDPDLPDDLLAISAEVLPNWLSLLPTGNGTATLQGTPRNSDVGNHQVKLIVEDLEGLTDEQIFVINVANSNDPPFFTSTPNTSGTQDQTYTYLATASDPDLNDTLTMTAIILPGWLTLTDGGNGSAVLNGIPANADVGINQVQIQVEDVGGLTALQTFNINVANVNDPPVFTSTAPVTGTQGTTYTYNIVTFDPDRLVTNDNLDITAPVLPSWLNLTDNGDGTGLLIGIPGEPDVGDHDVTLRVEDSAGAFDLQSFTIDVAAINNPPVIDLNGLDDLGEDFTAVFIEDGGAKLIVDTDLSVTDPDDNFIQSALITLTNNLDGISETLTANNLYPGLITIVYSDTTGVLSLNGQATKAQYQNVLRTVRYNNISDDPVTLNRIVNFTIYDDEDPSNTATSTIIIQATNDPPELDLNGGDEAGFDYTATFNEGGGPVAIVDTDLINGVSVTDADNNTLQWARATLTNILDPGEEALNATGGGGIVVNYDSGTGVLNMTGAASIAQYEAVLRTVTYNNVSADPATTPRTIIFVVSDGTSQSNVATSTVIIQADDPPVLDLNGNGSGQNFSATYNPNSILPIAIVGTSGVNALRITDDGTTLVSASATITNLKSIGTEFLAVTPAGNTQYFYDLFSGVLTITPASGSSADIDDFEDTLRTLTYQNTLMCLNGIDQTPRIVRLVVNDGNNNSNSPRSTITFSPPCIAPNSNADRQSAAPAGFTSPAAWISISGREENWVV